MFDEEEYIKVHKGRCDLIKQLMLCCFVLIGARLWYLQVYQGDFFYRYSIENRLRKETVFANRGMIFDRNGKTLVSNFQRYNVVVIPQYLKNTDNTLNRLSKILEMDRGEIDRIIKRNDYQAKYRPITIKKDISWDKVAKIELENFQLPGIDIDLTVGREYADKEVGAHLLGHISEINDVSTRNREYQLGDYIGRGGIEQYFDNDLRGKNGHQFVQVDAFGRIRGQGIRGIAFDGIENKDSVSGNNILLTIDQDLQKVAYDLLKGQVGALIAMDVNTGEIISTVSVPSFDLSQFSGGVSLEYWDEITKNPYKPMIDRTIQEHYSPGSLFKVIPMIAALEEGVIDETTELSCEGYVQLGRKRYHCWKYHGHGNITASEALRESCDVFMYKLGLQLDIDVIARYARMFELGKPSKIDIPGEISGLIPTKAWKLRRTGEVWQRGETLSCSIGQSYVLTTLLQLVRLYAAIANGGKFYHPYTVSEIFSNDGRIISKKNPTITSELVITQKNLEIIRQGLFEVVNHKEGTAYASRGEDFLMSGKTGTSQVVSFSADKIYSRCLDNEYKYRHHAIFAGYAPSDAPQIAVVAVIEHGCSGGAIAAPIVKKYIQKYLQKYKVNHET